MRILIVRHAVAMRREDWKRPDDQRPLTPKGYRQSEALVGLLTPYGVERVLSSPFVRCVETVQPLAARLGLPVEERPELAEGAGGAAAALLGKMGESSVVLCSHGDVIPELLDALMNRPVAGAHHSKKGSIWLVDDGRAEYLEAPE